MSSEYASQWLYKDKSTIYERLFVLVQQGYVRKDYDSTFHLRLRPAIYSLSAKGIKYLRDCQVPVPEAPLRNMYKNHAASEELVDRSLEIFRLGLLIRKQYLDSLAVFTRSELSRYDTVIRPLPDLYLGRTSSHSTGPSYQLELIEAGTYTWIIRKRLYAHQYFLEERGYEDGTYPTMLLVCGNSHTEIRIQKLVMNSYFDFAVYTTTMQRLSTNRTKIWLTEYDPFEDEAMELMAL